MKKENIIGRKVKQRRNELNLTQQELAEKLGYRSRSSINKIESGENSINQPKIVAFAKVLKTTPSFLMGWEDSPCINVESKTDNVVGLTRIPMLGSICCGNGTFTNQEQGEYFGIDESVDADFCLNVKGNSMINAGICDGDKAFIRKVTDFVDGNIYAVISKGENTASLKKVYRMDRKIMLMPCNSEYDPEQKDSEDVCIVGECVGIYRDF